MDSQEQAKFMVKSIPEVRTGSLQRQLLLMEAINNDEVLSVEEIALGRGFFLRNTAQWGVFSTSFKNSARRVRRWNLALSD